MLVRVFTVYVLYLPRKLPLHHNTNFTIVAELYNTPSMSSPSPTRLRRALPSSAMPQRKHGSSNSCAHSHVTRLFDTNTSIRCQICHKTPNIGWVYRCAEQDKEHYLGTNSDLEEMGNALGGDQGNDADMLEILNPHIRKAIKEGHYTPEQIDTLIAQRVNVLETIKRQRATEAFEAALVDTGLELKPRARSLRGGSPQPKIRALIPAPELTQPAEEHKTPCSLQICHQCRPVLRERAFLSIDAVLESDYVPPQSDFDNRRVSDARIVAQIGLPKLKRVAAHEPPAESTPDSSDSNLTSANGGANVEANGSTPSKPGLRGLFRKKNKLDRTFQSTSALSRLSASRNSSKESLKNFMGSLIRRRQPAAKDDGPARLAHPQRCDQHTATSGRRGEPGW